jgi:hypothetical protein
MKKRRQRGILIPVSEYDSPPVLFTNRNYRYLAGIKAKLEKANHRIDLDHNGL